MRVDVTVSVSGRADVDVELNVDPDTPLSAIRVDLQRETGLPADLPLSANGLALRSDAMIGDEIPTGARLTSARSPRMPETPTLLQLDVVCGPDAGAIHLLRRGSVVIGREHDCAIRLADPDVSRHHARLIVNHAGVWIADLGSTNGSLVDGLPIGTEGVLLTLGAYLRIGDSVLALRALSIDSCRGRSDADGQIVVGRAPRGTSAEPPLTIERPTPPERRRQATPWLPIIVPSLAGTAFAMLLHNVQFLLFSLLSPLMAVGSLVGDRHNRREHRRRRVDYLHAHERSERLIAAALRDELAARRDGQPDAAAVAASGRDIDSYLWSRFADNEHACRVRIGLADRASATLIRSGHAVSEPAGTLPLVPAEIDLGKGAVAIVGPRTLALAIARWIVAQLAVQLSPSELALVPVVTGDNVADWEWMRWLPHVRHEPASTESRPWTVFVVDGFESADLPQQYSQLLRSSPEARVSAICVAERATELPIGCVHVVRAAGTSGSLLDVRGPSAASDVLADQIDETWADALARSLAPLRPAMSSSTDVPTSCRLIDLRGPDSVSPDGIVSAWQASTGNAATDLGLSASGPVSIDLARDGPHALVAGTTGSGKSELLRTLIVGLALRHPPDQLSFVLIDYKGGSAFSDCAALPHVCGVATDLDAAATGRVLQSLESEIRRREAVLAAVGARDLDAYRSAARQILLARLVLIVDEFATLVDDLPGFVDGLVDIARRGRSLGVHLVLATQRPSGVVSADIRANTALRIALRMNDSGESIDVVGSPDAACNGAAAGYAVMRTATGLTRLQTAMVSHPVSAGSPQVQVLSAWRSHRTDGAEEPPVSTTDLSLLVTAIRTATDRDGRARPAPPWLPPLPTVLHASALDTQDATVVPFGLVDMPSAQRQENAVVDLGAGGTVVFAGAAGSGRTGALSAVALRAAAQFRPDQLVIYVVDAGGGWLDPVATLPHCATAVGIADMPTVAMLVERLIGDLEQRREERRRVDPDLGPPKALLLIDGWETVAAAADAYDGGRTTDALLQLTRTTASSGLTVLIAGDRGALAPRISGAAHGVYALRLADRSDYALLGLSPSAVPASMPPGRAIRRDGALVQIAAADPMLEIRDGPPPTPRSFVQLRPLPDRIGLADIAPALGRFVVGVGGDAADPIRLDLFAGAARMFVVGPSRSGRSTVLRSFAEQALRSRVTVLLAAPSRSPLVALRDAIGLIELDPDGGLPALPEDRAALVIVDDIEALPDMLDAELTRWAKHPPHRLGIVVAGHRDEAALSFRGLAAQVRRSRCGIVLDARPADGELWGVRLPRLHSMSRAGRAVLMTDPAMCPELDGCPTAVQIALPASSAPARGDPVHGPAY